MIPALPLLLVLTSGTPGLTIHVDGVRSASGAVRCALHNDPAAFPTDYAKSVGHGLAPAQVGSVVVHIDVPAPGDYAVACFHDENGNGQLDMNFLHIPKEGLAASNDAKGHLGPPSFSDARFHYAGGELSLTVHMVY